MKALRFQEGGHNRYELIGFLGVKPVSSVGDFRELGLWEQRCRLDLERRRHIVRLATVHEQALSRVCMRDPVSYCAKALFKTTSHSTRFTRSNPNLKSHTTTIPLCSWRSPAC